MGAFWDERSREHIAQHGVTSTEVDEVLERSRPPFPEQIGDRKYLVHGRTEAGRFLQVIFVYRPVETLDWDLLDWDDQFALADEGADEVIYVIHARPLTESEKRSLRRRLQ